MLQNLFFGLSRSIKENCFSGVLLSLVDAFAQQGVYIDRMQIPISKNSGLRHPIYAIFLLTYKNKKVHTKYISHVEHAAHQREGFTDFRRSPYQLVIDTPNQHVRFDTNDNQYSFSLVEELRAQGFTEYLVANMTLPNGNGQFFSLATRAENGFTQDIDSLINDLYIPLSISLYGIYQQQVSISLAESYLGSRTAENVLSGKVYRGAQDIINAGVMFCDVRGFTSMSEQLGTLGVVKVMNDVFQLIEKNIKHSHGEILKFIGDALLIIFPSSEYENDLLLSRAMVESAQGAIRDIETHGNELGLPLAVGFGCHIGQVLYGNIGTNERLDFTVMGPTVNLTARLESMCKNLKIQLAVSTRVAKNNTDILKSFGYHAVKGISEPVEIWGLHSEK